MREPEPHVEIETGTIDLTHAAVAVQRCNFPGAELLANLEGHQLRAISWERRKGRDELQMDE